MMRMIIFKCSGSEDLSVTRISNRKFDLGREGQVKMVPLPSLNFLFFILAVLGCLSELL